MENATNALLIAGGILIAILILSVAVYLYVSYSHLGATYESLAEDTEMQQFNSNFTKFIGRTDITAQEIVTIINYCEEYTQNNGNGTVPEIAVVNASTWTVNRIKNDAIKFISEYLGKTFYCDVKNVTYDTTGRIKTITFIRNR